MKIKVLNSIFLFSLLISFLNCNKEKLDIQGIPEFEEFLQDELADQKIPAMSVLIFEGNDILYEKYLGISNLEKKQPLTSHHLFLLASVSKVVTATALLQLHEKGLFSLDDNINDYLPFQVAVPNQSTPISFRMLLTHTSGIADGSALDDQYYYGEDSPTLLGDFLEQYLIPGGQYYDAIENFHDFEPGTRYEYSNEGSALIGVLVEQISGKDFNVYCKEHIFQPLGMDHTFWRLDESLQSNSPLVLPYRLANNQLEALEHYTFTDFPNGGLRACGRDLHTFLSAFLQDGVVNNYQLLAPHTISSMITPQIPSIDKQVGFHLFQMDASNNLWGHDGGEEGVATIMAFNHSTKVGAIILTNQGDVDLDEILVEAYKLGLQL